ncbi:MAG: hypothetical protein K9K67_06510 [Bacteriovoracaceae bacterium]|nr:hypothetical protein [Bacteriovoracaceae bacterium]
MKKNLFCLWVIFFVSSCSTLPHLSSPYHCEKLRGGIDIGSGSTKVLVAKVNKCERKIITVVEEKNFPFKFKEALHLNNRRLPEDLYEKIKSMILNLKQKFKDQEIQFSGVATEVFREADNGTSFITRLAKETKSDLRVVDQEKEAELGFWGAVAVTGKKPEEILVWDIGGGSMQMTTMRKNHLFNYLGKLASVSLKNSILTYQKKTRGSPNPIGKYTALWAKQLIHDEALKIDTVIKEDAKNKEVIGIGGVHFYSIKNQLNLEDSHPYSQYQLNQQAKERVNWSDQRFSGSYKETEASNLLLVKSFMESLKIETVLPIKVNLATGILFDENLW